MILLISVSNAIERGVRNVSLRRSIPNYLAKQSELGEFKHHVFMYLSINTKKHRQRAFCAGNIITEYRVLTSSHCFLTNRKNKKYDLNKIKVAGGVLSTLVKTATDDGIQQWRNIIKIYSQRFFRFPAYDLAILQLEKPFIFNDYVNKIPYAKLDQDFDGVCITPGARTTQEAEGGGLICFGTGDPNEEIDGVLVGVATLINYKIPSLYSRVGKFYKWVTDLSRRLTADNCYYVLAIWIIHWLF